MWFEIWDTRYEILEVLNKWDMTEMWNMRYETLDLRYERWEPRNRIWDIRGESLNRWDMTEMWNMRDDCSEMNRLGLLS